ncbi:hypothetical protein LAJ19_13390 [Deinococcus taeanensis]|uniref:hypothetical protein n=1 Tax=Deinococcus taeanensis TaxID=2737050 RepID=UPI001CDBA242|nr:hypothetical protein [Deinococcus taeanensis]UBV42600.1 hypothetical protein LAJ19_13390 [Deinococcus taeanensis]
MNARPLLQTSRHHLKWDMRGLVALLEDLREATFEELLTHTPQGEHALRHLLKKAKKLGLIQIPVVRDDKQRFQKSKYRLTDFALKGAPLTAADYGEDDQDAAA